MTGRAWPILPTLQGYKASWLATDAIAGLTLVAIAIPEQMATAHLAGMPEVTGFYAFVAGSLLFAFFGRHSLMSVGADSTIAPVFAAGVATLAVVGSSSYSHLVSATALMAGGLLVVAGLLRLGWIADFFPVPVLTGLLAGIGVGIFLKQLPTVLGLPGGGTTTVGRLRTFVDQLSNINGWSLAIALGVLVIIVICDSVDRRIPGALLAIVGATALVNVAGLTSHGVEVVGLVQAEMPHLGLPGASLHQLGQLVVTAVTVAFLCTVQTSATVRSPATSAAGTGPASTGPASTGPASTGPASTGAAGTGSAGTGAAGNSASETSPEGFNIDLAAVGAGSILAGLAGSFAVDASPPRTAVVASAGGRSQVASLTAVGAVVLVLIVATGLLKDLPEAALGAVLMFVASKLFRFGVLRSIFRFNSVEFALAVITLAVVVFVGIEQGVVAAALLALAQRTRLAARPRDAVLGRVPGTDHWIQTDIGQPTERVPGVVVYLLYAPLWYGNATHVVDRIRQIIASAPEPVHTLVLDGDAMSDIDYTGAKALGELLAQLQKEGIAVAVARASEIAHRDLRRSGLLDAIGTDRVFTNVDAAVRSLSQPQPRSP
jgi:sulfate permease, SulP family